MNEDLDVELRRRLEGLAASVPVNAAGELARVASGVKPGRAARLAPSGALLAVAVAAILVAALSGGVGQRPATTGAATSESPGPENGPVTTTAVDGAFELAIRSARGRYQALEPIDVEASLTYHGPEAEVTICDDGGPIGFGVREKVLGGINLEPVSQLMIDHTTLLREVPLTKPFMKSGGFSGDDPAAASFRAFFADPVLRLTPGTWQIYAAAASCSPAPLHFTLNAQVEISVDGTPATAPSTPSTRSPAGTAMQIRTAAKPNTSGECMAARIDGALVSNPTTGLGIETSFGAVDVIWPFGWTAWRNGRDVALYDEAGSFIARIGDLVAFSGGMTSRPTGPPDASMMVEDAFAVCGEMIQLSPPP